MQNSYVHQAGQWHLTKNTYAHQAGQWHLVKNAYVHQAGQWHLTQSAGSNLDQEFNYAGDFTYTVPDGVYNLKLTYPTPAGMTVFGIQNVTPGQEIAVKIGEYGSTSSVYVNTSTSYILPAFDTTVISVGSLIDGWLIVDYSAATPTGVGVTSASTNEGVSTAAAGVGALYTVKYQGYHGDIGATVTMSPVKSEVITNWPRVRVVEKAWSGRNITHSYTQLELTDGFYVSEFRQNDDPQRGEGYYSFRYNIQQILKLTISPAGTGTVSGSAITISPSIIREAVVGVGYTLQFSASGGSGIYTWSSSGIGSSLNSSTGLLSYNPLTAGSLPFTISATDTTGLSTSSSYTLTILASAGTGNTSELSISPTSLPGGVIGSAYNQTITVSGGTPPYSWNIVGYTPVDGISINAGSTVVITGTPTASGSVVIPYSITDSSDGGVLTKTGSLSFQVAATSSPPSGITISPSSGPRTGGTTVIISGSNFTGATAAQIGGVPVTGFAVLNSTTIQGTTAAASSGIVSVVVYNASGSGTGSNIFTYT
jgi:hypothetical protein